MKSYLIKNSTSGCDDDVTEENISDHAEDEDDAVDRKKYPSENKKDLNLFALTSKQFQYEWNM